MDPINRAYLTALVKRAQQNDSDAFAELYAMTYKAQYIFAKTYLRDEHLAQDAIQEVYILALKNLSMLKEPKFFNTWIRQINLRVCYDLMEKQKRDVSSDTSVLETVADESPSSNPEVRFINNLDSEELRQAVLKLPQKERDAIIFKFSGNMSLNDIADMMDCSISSVTRYLSRGYIHLKEMLKKGENTS